MRGMAVRWFAVAGLLALNGCAVREVRWSSDNYLQGGSNQVVVAMPVAQAAQSVTRGFVAHTIPQVGEGLAPDGARVMVFSTPEFMSVGRHAVPGSRFWAKLSTEDAMHTRVELLGKPYFFGELPCSNSDASFGLACARPLRASEAWANDIYANGQFQARIIAQVLQQLSGVNGSENVVEPSAPPPPED